MSELTSPDRRRMLGGVPAFAWLIVATCCIWVGLVGVVAFLLFGGAPFPGSAAEASAALSSGAVFFMAVSYLLFELRTRKELELRYTTNPLKHPQVVLCDWRTGAVLREAGSPMLSWAEFIRVRRQKRQAMREWRFAQDREEERR